MLGSLRPMYALASYCLSHPLGRRSRLRTLWRIGWWQVISRIENERVVDFVDDTRLLVSRGMTGATGNIYVGLHEYCEMAFLLHLLRDEDVFLDIGANVGSYTVLAAGVAGSTVHAFEPIEATCLSLKANVELNSLEERVTIHRCAVSQECGTVSMTECDDTMNRVIEARHEDAATVQAITLDSLELAPTFMKLDVEGHELEALKGARKTLQAASLLAVQAESASPGDCVSTLLGGYGFKPFSYCPAERALDDWTPASNTIFVRDAPLVSERLANAPSFFVRRLNVSL